MPYAKPQLEDLTEVSVAPDVGTSIVIISAADLVIFAITTFSSTAADPSESSLLATTAPFALDIAGDTFTVSIVQATINANGVITVRCAASFSNPALFGPDPIPPVVDPSTAFFAVAGIVVENDQLVEFGSGLLPLVGQGEYTGSGGQIELSFQVDASALNVGPGARIALAVSAGGDVAANLGNMNAPLEVTADLQSTTQVPVGGWPLLPGLMAMGAYAIARRRRRSRNGNGDDHDEGDARDPVVLLTNLGWMRRQRAVRVIKSNIDKA